MANNPHALVLRFRSAYLLCALVVSLAGLSPDSHATAPAVFEHEACAPAEGPADTRARIVARIHALAVWSRKTDSTTLTGEETFVIKGIAPGLQASDRSLLGETSISVNVRTATVAASRKPLIIRDIFVPGKEGLPSRYCAQVLS